MSSCHTARGPAPAGAQFLWGTAAIYVRDSWVMTGIIYNRESAGLYWDFCAWLHSLLTFSLFASDIRGTLLLRMLLYTLCRYLWRLSVEDKSVHCISQAALVPHFKSLVLAPVSQSWHFMPDGHTCWASMRGKDFTHVTDTLTHRERDNTLAPRKLQPPFPLHSLLP